MVDAKPKVGLLLLAAEWFWQQNIQGHEGRYSVVSKTVDADVRRIVERLTPHMDLVDVGLIHTVDNAARAAQKLKASDIDLLLICSVIWSEDLPLMRVLDEMPGVPLLTWCYVPHEGLPEQVTISELFRRSGPVGMAQHSAVLKRLGRKSGFVCGSLENEQVIRQINDYANAAQLAKHLKSATIGMLPYRCDCMTGTYVDEFRLMTQLGPSVMYVSIRELAAVIESITIDHAQAFVDDLKSKYEVCGVSDESLLKTARASLGLTRLCEDMGLDAIALSDLVPELHEIIGVRPFLCVPDFYKQGRVLGLEGDLATTAGMLIASRLSSQPPMYTEIFTFDQSLNAVLAGHAGMHDVRLAEDPSRIRITPDYEYYESNPLEGAWLEFRGKPGRVTMASFFCDVDTFKIVVAEGESITEGPRLEGFANMLIRLDTPVQDFFRHVAQTGLTQHWVIVHDDIVDKLEMLADILGLRFETIGAAGN